MKNLAHQTYEEFRLQDRQRILAANPTIDQLIADYSYYRFCWAVNQACRVAGGLSRAKKYEAQDLYLAKAIAELESSGKRPTQKRLELWIEGNKPEQEFSDSALKKAIATYRKTLRASTPAD